MIREGGRRTVGRKSLRYPITPKRILYSLSKIFCFTVNDKGENSNGNIHTFYKL